MDRKRQAILLALPASLALLVFFIIPMVYMLVKTIAENGFADFVDFFTDPFYLDILWTTEPTDIAYNTVQTSSMITRLAMGTSSSIVIIKRRPKQRGSPLL